MLLRNAASEPLPLKLALGARLRWRSCDQPRKGSRRRRKSSPTSHARWCAVQKTLHVALGNKTSRPGETKVDLAKLRDREPKVLEEKIRLRVSVAGQREQTCRPQRNSLIPPPKERGENARARRALTRKRYFGVVPYVPEPVETVQAPCEGCALVEAAPGSWVPAWTRMKPPAKYSRTPPDRRGCWFCKEREAGKVQGRGRSRIGLSKPWEAGLAGGETTSVAGSLGRRGAVRKHRGRK